MRLDYKVAIIVCYLGKLPDYFSPFLISCSNNPAYQWIVITDDHVANNLPPNVTVINLSIKDIEKRIKVAIGDWAELNTPYKLCDYKPAFGLIFQDFLAGYTHWGYGDIDVVYGQLETFISDSMLQTYDKIFPLGHFSILKNNDMCRKAFMLVADNTSDYRIVYSSDSPYYFDEYRGINEKMRAYGLKVFQRIDFLDASSGGYSRIHLIDKKIFKLVLPKSDLVQYDYPPNYDKQCFIIQEKRLFHVYIAKKQIEKKEYAYLHFRRRIQVELSNNARDMIIGKQIITDLRNDVTERVIKEYNNKTMPDIICFWKFAIKRYYKNARYSIKWKTARVLYSIKPVRFFVRFVKQHLNTP